MKLDIVLFTVCESTRGIIMRWDTRPPPSVDYNLIKNRKFQDGSQNFLEKINPKVLKFLQNHPYMLFRKYIVILADNYKFGVNDEKL